MKMSVFLWGLMICISLISCKAYRNPNNLKPKYSIASPELSEKMPGLQNLVVGDEIKVVEKDESVLYMKYEGVASDFIKGELYKQNGKKLKESKSSQIPLNNIDFIKVKRKSVGATLAWTLGLGIVTTVAVTAVLADLYSELGPDDL